MYYDVYENVHIHIITGTQIGRNGKINWHSKWKRLPTLGVAYLEFNNRSITAESAKAKVWSL